MNDIKATMHANLDKLIEKYSNNEYVFSRLSNHLENLLPTALENASELQKQREDRRNQLSANRDEFTSRFLERNRYFYSVQTELFLHYDGLHFVIHNEDNIQHQILSTISSEQCLREWKHKVNKNILKRIKERSPLNAIPESTTIQFVINTLCPAIFPSRNHAKYFLTILGECIYAKNTACIYILNPALKDIIREMGNQCYTYFGLANIFANIKFKYYEHNYMHCRLLGTGGVEGGKAYGYGRKKIPIPPLLNKYMLDFLCVAAHYATRFGTADQFLANCSESRLVEHSLFLTKNTQESIVDNFIEKSLKPCASSSSGIETKNMIFLWKKFIDQLAIPNIIFYEALKTLLKNKLKYDEATDCFWGITSIHLPVVAQFLKFWETTIIECDENEMEIEEICARFKTWSNNKNSNDTLILELIQHFYPELVIENKYILNIKCKI